LRTSSSSIAKTPAGAFVSRKAYWPVIHTCPEMDMIKTVYKIFVRVTDVLTNISGWLAALSLVAAAFIVTEAVIVRKLLGISTIWQIEASVMLLIFTVFVGAPFVQKNERHLNVDLVIIHLPPRTREITLIIVSILSCILAAILAWYAWPMWWETVVNNEHSESLWGPPLWIPVLFLPLGMTLLFMQYVVYIGRKIEALRKGELEEKVIPAELTDIKIGEDEAPRK
jgi:TRAP-type C4-dicarboxylate transport system permease small subunit